MRHVQQPQGFAQDTSEFRFYFQMADRGGRHACSVIIRATSKAAAMILFRENWWAIEKTARQSLASRRGEGKRIRSGSKRLRLTMQEEASRCWRLGEQRGVNENRRAEGIVETSASALTLANEMA